MDHAEYTCPMHPEVRDFRRRPNMWTLIGLGMASAIGRGEFQQPPCRRGSLRGARHDGISKELQPGFPIARQAHCIQ
ncbi:MAG: hypothetical protein OHM77_08915 [Candidatus Nitricoxidivorans perseverans]|uniref:Uncharacterized protein n=1 Tax=Candidatus Nitricoxidivorans perseverans TaxID=2975601 RepID=A0AA49FJI6_9PROT|nr:MAG: hypothetical protein OHM77_08915 [Candidatus Nitricoxidivorans perseverans]